MSNVIVSFRRSASQHLRCCWLFVCVRWRRPKSCSLQIYWAKARIGIGKAHCCFEIMSEPARIQTLYAAIEALPEGVTGEIIDGQLHTQPRPAGPHAVAGSNLGVELGAPYGRGRGGPGGWWIIVEPEIHFILDTEILVPDLGGWRRERMPSFPEDQRFQIEPDWVCEILSPSTASKDREIKLPVYARYGVSHAWLVDPGQQTIETFALVDGEWARQHFFEAEQTITAAPFEAAAFRVGSLWE